jgi:hypothetical protein
MKLLREFRDEALNVPVNSRHAQHHHRHEGAEVLAVFIAERLTLRYPAERWGDASLQLPE